jgi:hypothetical protein
MAMLIADSESEFNLIYHNNFINNTNDVNVLGFPNYFDNGYPFGGNYWSRHTAPDIKYGPYQNETGSDGIADEKYSYDEYPLVNPLTSFQVSMDGEQFQVEVSTNSSLNFYTFSPEKKSLNLFLSGTGGTIGSCRVLIPKGLLSCDSLSQWNITLSNSEQLTYLALEDEEKTYLYFIYDQLDNIEVQIGGTSAIPEFSYILWIFCFLGIIALLVIALKTKICLKPNILNQHYDRINNVVL